LTLPTDSNPREGKQSGIVGKIQAAEFTAEDDLKTALNLWSSPIRIENNPRKTDQPTMTSSPFARDIERFKKAEFPIGEIQAVLTPDIFDLIFRNSWGPGTTVGVNTTYALAIQPIDWLTLAWIENRITPNLERVVRMRDAWLHQLTFADFEGVIGVIGMWAARQSEEFDGVVAPIELPSPPMGPVGDTIFATKGIKIIRDPDGVAEEFPALTASLLFDHRVVHEWSMMVGTADVTKGGKSRVTFMFQALVDDESWSLIRKALADTKEKWRFEFRAVGATIRFDFASVDLNFNPIGREGLEIPPHTILGECLQDDTGTHVDITLIR